MEYCKKTQSFVFSNLKKLAEVEKRENTHTEGSFRE